MQWAAHTSWTLPLESNTQKILEKTKQKKLSKNKLSVLFSLQSLSSEWKKLSTNQLASSWGPLNSHLKNQLLSTVSCTELSSTCRTNPALPGGLWASTNLWDKCIWKSFCLLKKMLFDVCFFFVIFSCIEKLKRFLGEIAHISLYLWHLRPHSDFSEMWKQAFAWLVRSCGETEQLLLHWTDAQRRTGTLNPLPPPRAAVFQAERGGRDPQRLE